MHIKKTHILILQGCLISSFLYGCAGIQNDDYSDNLEQSYHYEAEPSDRITVVSDFDLNCTTGDNTASDSESIKDYWYGTLSAEDKCTYREIYACISNILPEVELTSSDGSNLSNILLKVLNDHPEIFWCDTYRLDVYKDNSSELEKRITSIFESSDNISYEKVKFVPIYKGTEKWIEDKRKEVEEKAEEYLDETEKECKSDYEKAKKLYELLIDNVDYRANAENNQNILSVFLNERTVCVGYAKAYKYLLDQIGIPCMVLTGNVDDGINDNKHMWNIIVLNGEPYHVDVTWGNNHYGGNTDFVSVSGDVGANSKFPRINYDYFCCTTSDILQTHTIDSEVPECISIMDNYFVKEGRFLQEYDEFRIDSIFFDNRDKTFLGIKCANKNIYNEACKYLFEDNNINRLVSREEDSGLYFIRNDTDYIISLWKT